MTDELTRAAATASEALGMRVEVLAHDTIDTPMRWRIRICPSLDDKSGGLPMENRIVSERTALAYLEGLETGARITWQRAKNILRLTFPQQED